MRIWDASIYNSFYPSWCQWIFHWHTILPIALWPWGHPASNINEYQEYFLGVKVAGAKADNLPPSCAVVTKSGNLNFLEPFGPVQACNGTVLPLPFTVSNSVTCVVSPAYSSPQFREKNSALILLLGHDRFFPNSVHLIIQEFSFYWLCKNLLCQRRKSEAKIDKKGER